LVRLQLRISKTKYLNGKRTYQYKRMSLPIPRRFHEIMESLLKRDINVNISSDQNGDVLIRLTCPKPEE
jgi:hypothetical protein